MRKILFKLCAASVLAFAMAMPAMAATQTLTILGGNGSYGQTDPYSEYTLDGGATWHQAYLSGTATSATTGYCYHPWGYVPGTNCWINQSPDDTVGTGISAQQPKTTQYRVRFYVPKSANTTTATATIDMMADNHADVSVNNVPMASFDSSFNGTATQFSSAVKPGQVNEIEISLTDWGGITGFNYNIGITMDASQPLAVLPASSSPAGIAMATGNLSRTPWQMSHPHGPYSFPAGAFTAGNVPIPNTNPTKYGVHGDPIDYTYASIPSANDASWGAAPNLDTIGFGAWNASILTACWSQVDYHYFQTFVTVPTTVNVKTFTIDFSGMDDGSRITLFNSAYPKGIVIPGSYVYLGKTGTSDLSSYVVPGVNRVVVTQVDDCPTGNNLKVAKITLNGDTITSNNKPPVANAGTYKPVECTGNGAGVTLDGSGSTDPDGDKLSYTWSWIGADGQAMQVTGENPTPHFPMGTTAVTLKVGDGHGAFDTATTSVTVVDTTPPTVTATLVPVPVHVHGHEGTFQVEFSASDTCDPSPAITSATLNGVPVANGVLVKLIRTHRHSDVDTDDGVLKIKAPSFTLLVKAQDASGNVGQGTASPVFPQRADDDNGIHRGNDMTDNHVDHGQHKSEGKTKIEHKHDRDR